MKPSTVATLLTLSIAGIVPASADCPPPNPDWANLGAYRAKNAELLERAGTARRVVFMGDSITEYWRTEATPLADMPGFFNRGISGQTTPQMLVRFRADVIDLAPRVVVILGGTNDLAGNTGPTTLAAIEANIASMAELASAHRIRVVLASVLPAAGYDWAPEIKPAQDILALNRWLRSYASQHGHGYIDFHSAMADATLGLSKAYSDDGVHPTAVGYALMNRLVAQALHASPARPMSTAAGQQ